MSFWGLVHVFFLILFDSVILFFCKVGRRAQVPVKKILVVRLDAIGDFVLWLGAAQTLRTLYPEKKYQLTLLGNSLCAPLAAEIDVFNDVWPLDRKRFIRSLIYRYQIIKKVRCAGFDVVVHPVVSRELCYGDTLVRASGAQSRIGSSGDTSNTSYLAKMLADRWYTKLIPVNGGNKSELRRHTEFMRGLGCSNYIPSIPTLPVKLDLPVGFDLKEYVVVVPGAGARSRQWPLENFIEISRLVYGASGVPVVVCGDKTETCLGNQLLEALPGIVHNWAGQTNLLELVAIIGNAKFVVSNETSAVHVAAVSGVPSVCILGGGHFGRFLPYSDSDLSHLSFPVYLPMDCYDCNWDCCFSVSDGAPVPCIKNIEVAAVWKAVNQVLLQQK